MKALGGETRGSSLDLPHPQVDALPTEPSGPVIGEKTFLPKRTAKITRQKRELQNLQNRVVHCWISHDRQD